MKKTIGVFMVLALTACGTKNQNTSANISDADRFKSELKAQVEATIATQSCKPSFDKPLSQSEITAFPSGFYEISTVQSYYLETAPAGQKPSVMLLQETLKGSETLLDPTLNGKITCADLGSTFKFDSINKKLTGETALEIDADQAAVPAITFLPSPSSTDWKTEYKPVSLWKSLIDTLLVKFEGLYDTGEYEESSYYQIPDGTLLKYSERVLTGATRIQQLRYLVVYKKIDPKPEYRVTPNQDLYNKAKQKFAYSNNGELVERIALRAATRPNGAMLLEQLNNIPNQ